MHAHCTHAIDPMPAVRYLSRYSLLQTTGSARKVSQCILCSMGDCTTIRCTCVLDLYSYLLQMESSMERLTFGSPMHNTITAFLWAMSHTLWLDIHTTYIGLPAFWCATLECREENRSGKGYVLYYVQFRNYSLYIRRSSAIKYKGNTIFYYNHVKCDLARVRLSLYWSNHYNTITTETA